MSIIENVDHISTFFLHCMELIAERRDLFEETQLLDSNNYTHLLFVASHVRRDCFSPLVESAIVTIGRCRQYFVTNRLHWDAESAEFNGIFEYMITFKLDLIQCTRSKWQSTRTRHTLFLHLERIPVPVKVTFRHLVIFTDSIGLMGSLPQRPILVGPLPDYRKYFYSIFPSNVFLIFSCPRWFKYSQVWIYLLISVYLLCLIYIV